jgi:hypothetical protein
MAVGGEEGRVNALRRLFSSMHIVDTVNLIDPSDLRQYGRISLQTSGTAGLPLGTTLFFRSPPLSPYAGLCGADVVLRVSHTRSALSCPRTWRPDEPPLASRPLCRPRTHILFHTQPDIRTDRPAHRRHRRPAHRPRRSFARRCALPLASPHSPLTCTACVRHAWYRLLSGLARLRPTGQQKAEEETRQVARGAAADGEG